MTREKHSRLGATLSLAALILPLVAMIGCTRNGWPTAKPSVFIVPDSRSVSLIDPNVPFIAKRRSAVLDIGYYMELVDLEMEIISGKWKRVEP